MLSASDQSRVAAAIAAAEATTTGEIFCIVSTRVIRFPATALLVAAVLGMALPFVAAFAGWPVWALGGEDWSSGPVPVFHAIEAFFLAQLACFAVLEALLWLTKADRLLTPRAHVHRELKRIAAEQFAARGLSETVAHTGIMIFASLPDRYAQVIADAGIYARVPQSHWRATIAALLASARAGDVAGGFVAAIELAGAVLAEHFPASADDVNELPDRIVQI